jgi:FlaA1/EpsC-like NDP-sugar epimerase
MGDQDVGADIQVEAAKQRDEDKRAAIIAAGHDGKSVIQAKKSTSPARPVDAEDETAMLAREKLRIERTIESLSRRLQEIEQQLITREEIGDET